MVVAAAALLRAAIVLVLAVRGVSNICSCSMVSLKGMILISAEVVLQQQQQQLQQQQQQQQQQQ
jgi:hypothetical protein